MFAQLSNLNFLERKLFRGLRLTVPITQTHHAKSCTLIIWVPYKSCSKEWIFAFLFTKLRFSQNCIILAFCNFGYTSQMQIFFKPHQILNVFSLVDYEGILGWNFKKKILILRSLLWAAFFAHFTIFQKNVFKIWIFQKLKILTKIHSENPSVLLIYSLCKNFGSIGKTVFA